MASAFARTVHRPTLFVAFTTGLAVTILGSAAPAGASPPPEAGDPIDFDQGLASGSWPDAVAIDVPPAPGQAPSVALVASHTTVDGPLGAGWSLLAGGAITRHGATGGVPNYGADRYRVDGMDLIAVTAPGAAHYEPEQWDGSRFDYDTATNTWTRKKAGWVWVYGSKSGTGVNATRLLGDGTVTVPNTGSAVVLCLTALCKTAAWELSQVKDPFGNLTLYNYSTFAVPNTGADAGLATRYPWTTTGELLLTSITYDAGAARVELVYGGDRLDPRLVVEDGRAMLRVKRLTQIKTTYNGNLFSRYGIQYEDEGSSTFLPAPLTDCDGVAVVSNLAPTSAIVRKIFRLGAGATGFPLRCLRSYHGATTFDDDADATVLSVVDPISSSPDATQDLAIPIALNLDGDGIDDLVVLGLSAGAAGIAANHHAYVATPTLDRRFAPATASGAPGQVAKDWEDQIRTRITDAMLTNGRGYAFTDLDANSTTELVWEDDNGKVKRDRLEPNGWVTSVITGLDSCDFRYGELADVDGDRFPDLIIRPHPFGIGCSSTTTATWIHNRGAWPYLQSADRTQLMVPLDGADGPEAWSDLFTAPPGDPPVCDSGVTWPDTFNANWSAESYVADHARFADFNHDGLVDVAYALYGCWSARTPEDSTTTWVDGDNTPIAGSEYSELFLGTGKGTFVATGLPAGAPLTVDTDYSSGSEHYPDRIMRGLFVPVDLDRDGTPELVHTANVGDGIVGGASSFRSILTGYQLDPLASWMDEDSLIAGLGYVAPGYECYQRTATSAFGDFDGDGFVDLLTIEADHTGDSPTCPLGEWCAVLRANHRSITEGRMISSDGPWGGRTALTWGFSARAPNSNPSLAANLEVVQKVAGETGEVDLTYSGAATYGGKPSPFAHVERTTVRGERDVFDFITGPWAPGQPADAARYRTNGLLEHATVFVRGAISSTGYWFSYTYPYFNPLARQCDYEVGNSPTQPGSLSALIDSCYRFTGTAPPVLGTSLETLEGHTWNKVPIDALPMVLGHTDGQVITGYDALYDATFGADAVVHGTAASIEMWDNYDLPTDALPAPTPLLRWPVPSDLGGAIPPVSTAEANYVYPTVTGAPKEFIEDWYYDVPTWRMVSSVEHRDTSTTADDRVHAFTFEQPDGINPWYRLTQDVTRDAAGTQLWRLTRGTFSGFDTAGAESACGPGGVCRTDQFEVNAAGALTSHTAPDLGVEKWTRSPCGQATSHTDQVGRKQTIALDSACRVASSTFEHGVVLYTRDNQGRIASALEDPGDGSISTEYAFYRDDALAPGEDTDYDEPREASRRSDGQVVLTYRDGFGRSTKQVECTDAGPGTGGGVFAHVSCLAGTERVRAWNLWGVDGRRKVAAEPFDPGETPVTHGIGHDGFGRPIVLLDPAHTESGPAWNQLTVHRGPAYIEVVDALGRVAQTSYTTLRRTERHAGVVRSIDDRDAAGRIIHTTDAAGLGTTFAYDALGNLTTATRDASVNCAADTGDVGPCTWIQQYTGYDASGRVVSERFPDGVNASYTYDAIGRRLTTKIAGTLVESLTYTKATPSARATIAVTYRSGGVRTSVRDGFDREVSATLDGTTEAWVWGANGELISAVDANGRVTRYGYDLHDDLTSSLTPEAGTTTIDSDGHGRPVLITDADGATTRQAYTYAGDLARRIVGDTWTVVDRSYDSVGRAIAGLDRGIRWATSWDVHDRPDVIQRGLGPSGTATPEQTVDLAFDAGDRLTERTVTARSGSTTTSRYTYDAFGELATMVPAITAPTTVWSYDHDIVGRVRFVHSPEGLVTETVYDKWGREKAQQVRGGWEYTSYTDGESYLGLDGLVRIDRWDAEDDATSGATDATYVDSAGREIAAIGHDGTERRSTWDGDDLVGQTWLDAGGAVLRQLDYLVDDATGRVARIDGPYVPGDVAIDTTGFGYTAAGRLASQATAEQTTTFGYDHGQLRTEAWDDQTRTIGRGDPQSLLPTQIDLAGTGGSVRSRVFARDRMGRVTTETVTAAALPVVKLTHSSFDAFGQPTVETRKVGAIVEATTTWTYGPLGRPSQRTIVTPGDTATTRWSWTGDGDLRQLTLPSGQAIAYEDGAPSDGLIDRVYDPTGVHLDYAAAITRNLRGQIVGFDQPADGTVRALSYDDAGRVVTRSSGPSGGVPVLDWTGSYDGLGRLTSEVIFSGGTGWTDDYTYDGRGRLAWERRGPDGTQRRYTYSTGGNLITTEVDTGTGTGYQVETTASYAGDLATVVDGVTLQRDAWQAITADQHGDALTYAADGEARTVTGPGAAAVTIVRDAAGLPIRHDEGGAMSRRVVYGLDPAALPLEVRESDGDIATYLAGAGQTLGQLRNGAFQNAETRQLLSLLRYGTELTDPSSGFGADVEPPAGSPDERFLFAGLEQVKGAPALQLARHRIYDAATARFTAPDPIGLGGGTDRFRYAEADPINERDPMGWDNCQLIEASTPPVLANQLPAFARDTGGTGFEDPFQGEFVQKVLQAEQLRQLLRSIHIDLGGGGDCPPGTICDEFPTGPDGDGPAGSDGPVANELFAGGLKADREERRQERQDRKAERKATREAHRAAVAEWLANTHERTWDDCVLFGECTNAPRPERPKRSHGANGSAKPTAAEASGGGPKLGAIGSVGEPPPPPEPTAPVATTTLDTVETQAHTTRLDITAANLPVQLDPPPGQVLITQNTGHRDTARTTTITSDYRGPREIAAIPDDPVVEPSVPPPGGGGHGDGRGKKPSRDGYPDGLRNKLAALRKPWTDARRERDVHRNDDVGWDASITLKGEGYAVAISVHLYDLRDVTWDDIVRGGTITLTTPVSITSVKMGEIETTPSVKLDGVTITDKGMAFEFEGVGVEVGMDHLSFELSGAKLACTTGGCSPDLSGLKAKAGPFEMGLNPQNPSLGISVGGKLGEVEIEATIKYGFEGKEE